MSFEIKTKDEIINFIEEVLKQGDSRYNDSEAEQILSDFIIKQAIVVREKEIPPIIRPEEEFLLKHKVQAKEKYIAQKLLEEQGFAEKEIYFERNFLGLRPDLLAEKLERRIVVECCSCKISKVIEFLPEIEEIWVLTSGELPWEEKPLFKKMRWIIFTKGSKWNKTYKNFQRNLHEELKKIQSPIDSL